MPFQILLEFYSEFSKSFLKILLTSYRLCAIIANASGCGAVGSALPWGGRGRKFKSCHSDQTQKSPASLALTGFLLYAYKSRHALRNDTFSASTQMGVDVQGGDFYNAAVFISSF